MLPINTLGRSEHAHLTAILPNPLSNKKAFEQKTRGEIHHGEK
jgi:hypothetical protein